jgi:hypothetical protein
MKKFIAASVLICVCCLPVFTHDGAAYRRDFEKSWEEGETYAREIRPLLLAALGDPLLTSVGMAVVFPELSRYSYIQDVAETSALELFYVMYGRGNFSIGKFQMKPSFAVMIEKDADADCRLAYPSLFETGKNEKEDRALRIARLRSLPRQVEYFAVFLRIMNSRFPSLMEDPHRMVQIFSAAYNSGYDKSLERLEDYIDFCYFPYGYLGRNEQYAYCDIALLYYRENE